MKVVWSDVALAQIEAIRDFIASGSAYHARRVVDRIFQKGDQIAQFPLAGRMMPEPNFRQIQEALEGPYRIVYIIKADRIDVIAVLHGAQRTPWTDSSDN